MVFYEFESQRELQEMEALEQMYQQAIILSKQLGKAISEKRPFLPDSLSPDPVAYPPCFMKKFELDGSLVYQFNYEGMLPLYFSDKAYENSIRDYYVQATVEALADHRSEPFKNAIVYLCHYFSDLRIRDLDNRNRRHLINALRAARIIEDDSWKKMSFMESGYLDHQKKNRLELYVTSKEKMIDLLHHVDEINA